MYIMSGTKPSSDSVPVLQLFDQPPVDRAHHAVGGPPPHRVRIVQLLAAEVDQLDPALQLPLPVGLRQVAGGEHVDDAEADLARVVAHEPHSRVSACPQAVAPALL